MVYSLVRRVRGAIHSTFSRGSPISLTEIRQSRFVMKYRHCDRKLVLKVTDNRECLTFKTDQALDAKKMEKLNNIFFTLMSRGPDVDITDVTAKEQVETQPSMNGRGRRQ